MSRKGGSRLATAKGVSAINQDSLECLSVLPSATVPSATSNRSLSPKLPNEPLLQEYEEGKVQVDRQPSLQELIEAELTARFAPLQPDSLETLLQKEYHEHTRSYVSGSDVTTSCTTLLDSLEAPPFSLDSLADAESCVDFASPVVPNSGNVSLPLVSQAPETSDPFNCFNAPISSVDNNLTFSKIQTENIYEQGSCNSSNIDPIPNSQEIASSIHSGTVDLLQDLPEDRIGSQPPDVHKHILNKVEVDINELASLELTDDIHTFEVENTSEINKYDLESSLIKSLADESSVSQFTKKSVSLDLESNKATNNLFNGQEYNAETLISNEVLIAKDVHSSTEAEIILPELTAYQDLTNDLDSGVTQIFLVDVNPTSDVHEASTLCPNAFLEEKTSSEDVTKNVKVNNAEEGKITVVGIEVNLDIAASDNVIAIQNLPDIKLNSQNEQIYTDPVPHNDTLVNFEDHEVECNTMASANDHDFVDEYEDVFEDSESVDVHHILDLTSVDVANSLPCGISAANLIQNSEVEDVSVKTSSLHVNEITNGVAEPEDEELWPKESRSSKVELDEFQKMEQEVALDMENEKKKREGDKKGKKKRKKKGESEKENKAPSLRSSSLSSTRTLSLSDADEEVIQSTTDEAPSVCKLAKALLKAPPRNEGAEEGQKMLSNSFDNDDLSNISVKQLTASYLSNTVRKTPPRERSPSPSSVRPRTPISRLVETYSTPQPSNSSTPYKSCSQPSNSGVSSPSYPPDFTPGFSLQSLKLAYELNASRCLNPGEVVSARDEVNISFAELREAYCNVAGTPQERGVYSPSRLTPTKKHHNEPQNMTRSFTDLTRVGCRGPLKGSTTLLQDTKDRETDVPIFLGISVRQLRASYEDIPREVERDLASRDSSTSGSSKSPIALSRLSSEYFAFERTEPTQLSSECHICGKQVFQMEKIIAEKASWHKNCFRCKECNKNLTLETYQSHEGSLYCKPHFKELFRPKAVIQDEAEERKERPTQKPDYGLEELQQTLNMKERFAVFENLTKEAERPKAEPISVRRSQSLMSKAAKFLDGHEDSPCGDADGEYDDEDEEEGEGEGEGEEEGEEDGDDSIVRSNKRKKERPMSFSGMGDLKAAWEQKQRREEMSQSRKEEISRFRQMLCAGKNSTLKERFESGRFQDEDEDPQKIKEQIRIEAKRAASTLKKRFEQGEPFIIEDEDEESAEEEFTDEEEEGEEEDEDGAPKKSRRRRNRITSEQQEVEEIFKEAETAKKARNVFKQIDSKVAQEGAPVLRSHTFATSNLENRRSLDASLLMRQSSIGNSEVVKSGEKSEDFHVDTTDLASRFKFFLNYEKEQEKEREKPRKVFRITPPREGVYQDMQGDDLDVLGRDPNLIKCTDNYQDEIDCRNTKNILQMFKKMEMGNDEEEEEGPRPLKQFTPPPDGGEYDESDEEYSDGDYSDEEEEEDEEDEEGNKRPEIKDEILEMENHSQSARKAASLRAKFERWEAEVVLQNDINKDKDNLDDCVPSIDSAKNLKAMFEHKANEVAKPVASKPITQKVNRFV